MFIATFPAIGIKLCWAQMNYKYCAPTVLHRWNEWANKKERL